MKTLCAALTSKWIMTPDWIEESFKNNKWLDESYYGVKHKHRPLKSKKVFITTSFLKENANSMLSEKSLKILIESVGGGEIIATKKGSHYVLTSSEQADNLKNLNQNQFLELIQPLNN